MDQDGGAIFHQLYCTLHATFGINQQLVTKINNTQNTIMVEPCPLSTPSYYDTVKARNGYIVHIGSRVHNKASRRQVSLVQKSLEFALSIFPASELALCRASY